MNITEITKLMEKSLPDIYQLDFEKPGLRIHVDLSRDDPYIKSTTQRTISSITAQIEGRTIDLCNIAPEGSIFKLVGAKKSLHDKYGPHLPMSSAYKKDSIFVVEHDTGVFGLPGGVINHFHEIGHLWQFAKGRPTTEKERLLLESFNRSDDVSATDLVSALKKVEEEENDAWRYALSKYNSYKQEGIDLAPELSAKELNEYPQFWLELYNLDYYKTLRMVGRKNSLKWRPK